EPSHQLARVGEAAKVADLGRQDNRRHHRNAAQRLEGGYDRLQRPARQQGDHLLLEALTPRHYLLDGLDQLFEDDLLGGVLEALLGKPAPVRPRPVPLGRIDATVPQQKGCWRARRTPSVAVWRARTR